MIGKEAEILSVQAGFLRTKIGSHVLTMITQNVL